MADLEQERPLALRKFLLPTLKNYTIEVLDDRVLDLSLDYEEFGQITEKFLELVNLARLCQKVGTHHPALTPRVMMELTTNFVTRISNFPYENILQELQVVITHFIETGAEQEAIQALILLMQQKNEERTLTPEREDLKPALPLQENIAKFTKTRFMDAQDTILQDTIRLARTYCCEEVLQFLEAKSPGINEQTEELLEDDQDNDYISLPLKKQPVVTMSDVATAFDSVQAALSTNNQPLIENAYRAAAQLLRSAVAQGCLEALQYLEWVRLPEVTTLLSYLTELACLLIKQSGGGADEFTQSFIFSLEEFVQERLHKAQSDESFVSQREDPKLNDRGQLDHYLLYQDLMNVGLELAIAQRPFGITSPKIEDWFKPSAPSSMAPSPLALVRASKHDQMWDMYFQYLTAGWQLDPHKAEAQLITTLQVVAKLFPDSFTQDTLRSRIALRLAPHDFQLALEMFDTVRDEQLRVDMMTQLLIEECQREFTAAAVEEALTQLTSLEGQARQQAEVKLEFIQSQLSEFISSLMLLAVSRGEWEIAKKLFNQPRLGDVAKQSIINQVADLMRVGQPLQVRTKFVSGLW